MTRVSARSIIQATVLVTLFVIAAQQTKHFINIFSSRDNAIEESNNHDNSASIDRARLGALNLVYESRERSNDDVMSHGEHERSQQVTLPPVSAYTVIGRARESAGFLTIGMRTAYHNMARVEETLNSLLSNIPSSEVDSVVIMVFIADLDTDKRHTLTQALVSRYPDQLNSGLLQVVTVNASVYPPLHGIFRRHSFPLAHVRWRAKQVIDLAYMFHYGASLAHNYVHIDDDVSASADVMTTVRQCVEKFTLTWSVLKLAEGRGMNGKMFHSSDLTRLAAFFALFYDTLPADVIYERYFGPLWLTKGKSVAFCSALFTRKQQGQQAEQQGQVVEDASESLSVQLESQLIREANPPADVCTTMSFDNKHPPANAYNEDPGMVFAAKSPNAGDVLTIAFKQPVAIDRVEIYTAADFHEAEYMRAGIVSVSSEPIGAKCQCQGAMRDISNTTTGDFTVSALYRQLGFKVACLQLTVTQSQTSNLAVKLVRVTRDIKDIVQTSPT